MKKYTVRLTQTDYEVIIQVESDLSIQELEAEISETAYHWRLPRLSEKELIREELIEGYIKGSYFIRDGDWNPSSYVVTTVEESKD
jgi:hypothetical protein